MGYPLLEFGEKEEVEDGSVNGTAFVWVEGRVGPVSGGGCNMRL